MITTCARRSRLRRSHQSRRHTGRGACGWDRGSHRNRGIAGDLAVFWIGSAGAIFGLLFDSLLGATLERQGWLNNDGVNFLSTASAAAFALLLLVVGIAP